MYITSATIEYFVNNERTNNPSRKCMKPIVSKVLSIGARVSDVSSKENFDRVTHVLQYVQPSLYNPSDGCRYQY